MTEIRFLTREEGGRSVPVNNGYRAQFVFEAPRGASSTEHDCVVDFSVSEKSVTRDGEIWMPLGLDDVARIAPFDADRVRDVLIPGARFTVLEGRRVVGAGRVLEGLAVSD